MFAFSVYCIFVSVNGFIGESNNKDNFLVLEYSTNIGCNLDIQQVLSINYHIQYFFQWLN